MLHPGEVLMADLHLMMGAKADAQALATDAIELVTGKPGMEDIWDLF